MVNSYKDLEVWKKGIELTRRIYELTGQFPREEIYGLTSQIRRSASSIPANIAEGSNRGYLKEYINFTSIAYGSGAELETLLTIARSLGYLSEKDFIDISPQLDEIMRMLNGLLKKLKSKRDSA